MTNLRRHLIPQSEWFDRSKGSERRSRRGWSAFFLPNFLLQRNQRNWRDGLIESPKRRLLRNMSEDGGREGQRKEKKEWGRTKDAKKRVEGGTRLYFIILLWNQNMFWELLIKGTHGRGSAVSVFEPKCTVNWKEPFKTKAINDTEYINIGFY